MRSVAVDKVAPLAEPSPSRPLAASLRPPLARFDRPRAERPRKKVARSFWWLGLAASVGLGLFLSALAYSEGLPRVVQETPQLDKVLHFSLTAIVGFFFDGVLARRMLDVRTRSERAPIARVPIAALLILVPAGIEEYLQRFTSNRTSSIYDFAADVAGVVFGIWLSRRVAD